MWTPSPGTKVPNRQVSTKAGQYHYVTKGRVDCSGRRAIWIEAIHKNPPDMEKLAKALLYLAEQLRANDDQGSSDSQMT